MSKAEKLIEELVANYAMQQYMDNEGAVKIISKHLRDVHEEAVTATIMASHKKQFVKPEFKD